MDPKIQPSLDFLEVEPSTTGFTLPPNTTAKSIRVDQTGVATISSNAGTNGLFNCVQSETLALRGENIAITTDATCRLHVYL